jgi:hypothetical protein
VIATPEPPRLPTPWPVNPTPLWPPAVTRGPSTANCVSSSPSMSAYSRAGPPTARTRWSPPLTRCVRPGAATAPPRPPGGRQAPGGGRSGALRGNRRPGGAPALRRLLGVGCPNIDPHINVRCWRPLIDQNIMRARTPSSCLELRVHNADYEWRGGWVASVIMSALGGRQRW